MICCIIYLLIKYLHIYGLCNILPSPVRPPLSLSPIKYFDNMVMY